MTHMKCQALLYLIEGKFQSSAVVISALAFFGLANSAGDTIFFFTFSRKKGMTFHTK